MMKVWRRPSFGTAGPLGGEHPLVTKEGHHVFDVIFTTPIPDLGMPYADGRSSILATADLNSASIR